MSRPRRVSDDEILAELRRAVLEQGPHVPLDLVAERLGVTTPALFRRFGSRKDLLAAALRPEERPPYIDRLDAGPGEGPVEAQLAEVLTLIGEHVASALPCMSALRESGIDYREAVKEYAEPPPLRTVRALAGWLARARRAGLLVVDHVDSAATAMVGAVQAPIFFRHIARSSEPHDPAAYARRLARLYVRGLAPAASAAPSPLAAATIGPARRRAAAATTASPSPRAPSRRPSRTSKEHR